MKLRPEIQEFAEQMEKKMRIRDAKYGEQGWKEVKTSDLFNHLLSEVEELSKELDRPFPQHANEAKEIEDLIRMEAVDVANLAMMIWGKTK